MYADLSAVLIIVTLCVVCAWIKAVAMFVKLAKAKGLSLARPYDLWIIGLFASPIVLGLYVCAMSGDHPSAEIEEDTRR